MDNLVISASPHITKKHNTTRRIMLYVLIALLPCIIAATYFFGYHVLINIVFCVGSCFLTEFLFEKIMKRGSKIPLKSMYSSDLSACVTGVILALNLPATMNIWGLNIKNGSDVLLSFDTILCCILGGVVAILLVKQLFGGIGSNVFNPAATARVFLFLCFGATAFVSSSTLGLGIDAWTGATWLSKNVETTGTVLLDLFIGNTAAAAVGETCCIAIIIGCVFLCIVKVIDFRIPLMIVGFSAVFALFFDGIFVGRVGVELWTNTLAHILSGGLLFGAVFMATDYASSPNTFIGNVIFCFGIALITMIIRVYAGFPEGVSFAIIIMNMLSPLIDLLVLPKPFGYVKEKKKNA